MPKCTSWIPVEERKQPINLWSWIYLIESLTQEPSHTLTLHRHRKSHFLHIARNENQWKIRLKKKSDGK